jgi:UDP-glucuronate 4-epimerase
VRPGILITGGAGFIGSHAARRFLRDGWRVGILDNFDDFYSPAAKRQNILGLPVELFTADIRDRAAVDAAVAQGWDAVLHLAAKAGVRPSINDPHTYLGVNVTGTLNVLEAARKARVRKLIFASSSSVYGSSNQPPFREDMAIPSTLSPYAATKVAGEHLCSNYANLHGIQCVCLRFFTVYGPGQRPDLAIRKFATAILEGRPITVYGDGTSKRDYTFVDDTVEGIRAAADFTGAPFSIFNLGSGRTTTLNELVSMIEDVTERRAVIERRPAQPGDMTETWADISAATERLGYQPCTGLREGLQQTVDWLTAPDIA